DVASADFRHGRAEDPPVLDARDVDRRGDLALELFPELARSEIRVTHRAVARRLDEHAVTHRERVRLDAPLLRGGPSEELARRATRGAHARDRRRSRLAARGPAVVRND